MSDENLDTENYPFEAFHDFDTGQPDRHVDFGFSGDPNDEAVRPPVDKGTVEFHISHGYSLVKNPARRRTGFYPHVIVIEDEEPVRTDVLVHALEQMFTEVKRGGTFSMPVSMWKLVRGNEPPSLRTRYIDGYYQLDAVEERYIFKK